MLDVVREIQLFKSVKDDFARDVKESKIRDAADVLPWLKTRIPSKTLTPDTEFGFSSVEEELNYAIKLAAMLYNPIRYVFDSKTRKERVNRESEVYFGDWVMSRNRRDNLLKTAISKLDENDGLERMLKTHLRCSMQAEETVGFMMLLRTQPEN